ncbi:hypothetical protein EVG20_g1104 [Dentipellis fragilis]|uniref:Tetraspanin Tsp2 n=1 Tax=Dentipellis fragilis TaxID=205917 RepID=A0A4Y9ZCK1_9AGAM|nr:hypothetical protein EVG20_g1104 [Dentipellis fragilis]
MPKQSPLQTNNPALQLCGGSVWNNYIVVLSFLPGQVVGLYLGYNTGRFPWDDASAPVTRPKNASDRSPYPDHSLWIRQHLCDVPVRMESPSSAKTSPHMPARRRLRPIADTQTHTRPSGRTSHQHLNTRHGPSRDHMLPRLPSHFDVNIPSVTLVRPSALPSSHSVLPTPRGFRIPDPNNIIEHADNVFHPVPIDGNEALGQDAQFSLVALTPRPARRDDAMTSHFASVIDSPTSLRSSQASIITKKPGIISKIHSSLLSLRNLASRGEQERQVASPDSSLFAACPQLDRSGSGISPSSTSSTAHEKHRGDHVAKLSTPIKTSISAVDRFTHKWPRPKTLRSVPPGFRAKHAGRYNRAGGWSESEIKAALAEGKGLGMDWAGQWTPHKWCLLVSVTLVFACGLAGVVCALLTWFAAYPAAPVLLITDSSALVLLTLCSSLFLLASITGIAGVLMNSRPILAVYTMLLFPCLIALASVGYVTYKKDQFSLDRKLSEAWNKWYAPGAQLVLQSALQCCGWASSAHAAVPSGRCYERTPLPGCRGALTRFERSALPTIYGAVFSLVPLHLMNIIAALLCSNHVTRRFGKGIMPKRYRLRIADVASITALTERLEEESRRGSPARMVALGLPQAVRATSTGLGLFREDREDRRFHPRSISSSLSRRT